MGQASTLAEFTEALKGIGVPVFHTLAADRHGDAFYGEVSGVPHVTERQRDVCATDFGRFLASASNQALTVLDGSSRACEWGEDPDSPPDSNLYGYEARPRLLTTDYVGNGNDSYWLSNADRPLTGYPLVFGWLGGENQQQSLRTRIGHLMVRERRTATDGLDPAPGFTLDSLKALMYRNRVYGAEIVLDDVLALCGDVGSSNAEEERARRACSVLARWDRKVDPDSRGAQVFTEFWRRVHRELGSEFAQLIASRDFWEIDFDPADPLNTPRGIDRSRPDNRELVIEALSGAVQSLEAAGVALDAPWRDVQFVTRNGVRIPVHGGDPRAGVYGAISASLGDGRYTPWSGTPTCRPSPGTTSVRSRTRSSPRPSRATPNHPTTPTRPSSTAARSGSAFRTARRRSRRRRSGTRSSSSSNAVARTAWNAGFSRHSGPQGAAGRTSCAGMARLRPSTRVSNEPPGGCRQRFASLRTPTGRTGAMPAGGRRSDAPDGG